MAVHSYIIREYLMSRLTKEEYRLKEDIKREVIERVRDDLNEEREVVASYKEKVEIVSRNTLVRPCVLKRRGWAKWGSKANEARGTVGAETVADD